jgi:hypothetical protein
MAAVTLSLRNPIGPQSYPYQILDHVDPEDICGICREPYTVDGQGEGCRPILLTECRHIVGLECFERWLGAHPDTCTHWNHALQRDLSGSSYWGLEWCLEHVYSTKFFAFLEENVMYIVAMGTTAHDFRRQALVVVAFTALREHRLSFKHANMIFRTYLVGIAAIAFVHIFLFPYAVCLAGCAAFLVLYLPLLSVSAMWGVLCAVGSKGAWVALYLILTACVFVALCMGVVLCAVGLGWWRSRRPIVAKTWPLAVPQGPQGRPLWQRRNGRLERL